MSKLSPREREELRERTLHVKVFIKIGDYERQLGGTRKRIFLDKNNPNKATLVRDGRPLEKVGGKWFYIPK